VARWFLPDGSSPRADDWNDPAHKALALQLDVAPGQLPLSAPFQASCMLIINGAAEALRFELPPGAWFLHIDTAGADCLNRRLNDAETLAPGSMWLASAAPA
jgi:pullulanase/glycogen debranching enzyme